MKIINLKNIGFAILLSVLLAIIVKASSPYTVSVKKINDAEFPRVQVAMEVSGDTSGMTAKHFEVLEQGKMNDGPRVLLPPKNAGNRIDLYILLDDSANAVTESELIKQNLSALINYCFDLKIDLRIILSTFEKGVVYQGVDRQAILSNINTLTFSESSTSKVDGFGKIMETASLIERSGAEKVLLLINASDF